MFFCHCLFYFFMKNWDLQSTELDPCLFFFKFISGSGLHTFVLYLGPHIALFTIKAMQCGRVDLKSAPYDTIQLKRGPSWLDRDCHEFGDPVFPLSHGLRVPLSSILPQVQVEAILWGVGTALGELPPYFISRAGMYNLCAAVIRLSGLKWPVMKCLSGVLVTIHMHWGCFHTIRLHGWIKMIFWASNMIYITDHLEDYFLFWEIVKPIIFKSH